MFDGSTVASSRDLDPKDYAQHFYDDNGNVVLDEKAGTPLIDASASTFAFLAAQIKADRYCQRARDAHRLLLSWVSPGIEKGILPFGTPAETYKLIQQLYQPDPSDEQRRALALREKLQLDQFDSMAGYISRHKQLNTSIPQYRRYSLNETGGSEWQLLRGLPPTYSIFRERYKTDCEKGRDKYNLERLEKRLLKEEYERKIAEEK